MEHHLYEKESFFSQRVLRAIKIMLVAILAAFFTLISLTNIIDYRSNWQFVQHVMSMDTTFQSPTLVSRSISNNTLQMLAYWLIIAIEGLAALFCWLGAIKLFLHRKQKEAFVHAKAIANIGLAMGLFLYLFFFLVVAGEWFVMWQSKQWNAQQKAVDFVVIILVSMIFVNHE